MATAQGLIQKGRVEEKMDIVSIAFDEGVSVDTISKITRLAPLQVDEILKAKNELDRRRAEFREWVTPHMKAEFINGEIIVHSPVKREHWKITDLFSRLLSYFSSKRNLGSVGVEKVMIALEKNDYEPDLVFFSTERSNQFDKEQVLFPAPDFVVEILSNHTSFRDKGIKKKDYAAAQILEYWIIDPVKQHIEQYLLNGYEYNKPIIFDINQVIESTVIKGFKIPVLALFDSTVNLKTMEDFMKM